MMVNTSFNREEYVQLARTMYRQETEKRHKDALIECFSEDFSNLSEVEKADMQEDLIFHMQECQKALRSAQGKEKIHLQKDWELFSLLAKELGMESAFEKQENELIQQDLEMLNKALQKGEDDPLWKIEKADFVSNIAQEKFEEFDTAMKDQPRGIYSRSVLLQKLGDYLEWCLHKEKQENELIQHDLEMLNKALQKGEDDPLWKIEKADFVSNIAQEKFEELDTEMKDQPRGIYSRSILLQKLGDYLEWCLHKEKQEAQKWAVILSNQKPIIITDTKDRKQIGKLLGEYVEFEEIKDEDWNIGKESNTTENTNAEAQNSSNPPQKLLPYQKEEKSDLPPQNPETSGENWSSTQEDNISREQRSNIHQANTPEDAASEETQEEHSPHPENTTSEEQNSAIPEGVFTSPLADNTNPQEEEMLEEQEIAANPLILNAAISDTLSIHTEQAQLVAEEALKANYAKISKRNLFKKGAFFLARGKKRKKLIQEFMDKSSRSAFGDLVEDAADRHSREATLKMSEIKEQSLISIPEVNQLARDFIKGTIDEASFQASFDNLCANNDQLKTALENITHKGTNILHMLKLEKEQLALLENLAQTLQNGGNVAQAQSQIEAFIAKHQTNPDFLKQNMPELTEANLDSLKRYFQHQSALRKIAVNNLDLKLSIFTGGKSAYQINNADHEKGRIYKLGHKVDKLPARAQVAGFAGTGALIGLAGGPLGLGVVGTSLLTTGTFAGMSGFSNFIKKRTHYTKEHNTHEKNLTHSFDTEQETIKKWQDDLTKKWAKNWRKRYRAKRQLELYNNSTQQTFTKTQDFVAELVALSTSLRPLTDEDKAKLTAILIDGKARLDAYRQTGHNFLASSSAQEVESDMNQLYKALQLGAEKLGITFDQIDEQMITTDEGQLSYADYQKALLTDYSNANKHFRSQRRWLAGKYGVGSAALSAGTAIGMQYLMGTGMFAQESTLQTVSSTSQASWNSSFNLGSHTLSDGNQIQTTVSDQFSGLSDKASVVANYGAGTDATLVRAGSALASPEAYQAKLSSVTEQIKQLALSADQKEAFLRQLVEKPWELDRSKAFTNDYLQGDRCAEGLLQMAKGLANSGNQTLVPDLVYDAGRSLAGTTFHSAGERAFNIGLQITEQTVQWQAASGSTRFVPIVDFFNTFKKTKHPDQKEENPDSSVQEWEIPESHWSRENSLTDSSRQAPTSRRSREELLADLSSATPASHWTRNDQGIFIPAGSFNSPTENTNTSEHSPEQASRRAKFKSQAKNYWNKAGNKLAALWAGIVAYTWRKSASENSNEREKSDLNTASNTTSENANSKAQSTKEKIASATKKGREKLKQAGAYTAEKAQAGREKAKEKYHEKAPIIKEKAQAGREKTKEWAAALASTTKEQIKKLKAKLTDTEAVSEVEEKLKKIVKKADFESGKLDFEKNIYVVHQTLSSNADSILENGLKTKSGLNGTALFANKESIEQALDDMTKGKGHRGSDALVIMEFPRDEFKTKEKIELDDISVLLREKGEAKDFEVPEKYIRTIVKVNKTE